MRPLSIWLKRLSLARSAAETSLTRVPPPGTLLAGVLLLGLAGAEPYQVKPGETLYRIALRTGLSEQTIQKANPVLRGGHTVYAGQVLQIPPKPLPPGTFRVRKGENLKKLARRLGVGEAEIRRANPQIDRRGTLNAGQVLRLPTRWLAAQRKAEQLAEQLARQRAAQHKAAQQKAAQQKAAQQAALKKAAAAKAAAAKVAAAKAAAAKKVKPTAHRVQSGETFFSIARRYGINPIALQAYNPRSAGRMLDVGTVLTLVAPKPQPATVRVAVRQAPAPAVHTVRPLTRLPRTPSVWEWPVPGYGRVTSDFGWRTLDGEKELHKGIDVAAPPGTPVIAARSGRVIQAQFDQTYGWGWTVVIQHPDGWQSRYAHLSGISVQARQLVRQGERVGAVGSTGRVTGPHLHFGLYRNWDPHNPLTVYAGGAD